MTILSVRGRLILSTCTALRAGRLVAAIAGLESGQSEHDRVGYIKGITIQIFDKFRSLDDSNIECEVEESSPLAKYGHGNRYGYDPTRKLSR